MRRSTEGRSSSRSGAAPPRGGDRKAEAVIQRIQELLESTPARLAGLELVDVVISREGRRSVVRVLIDRDAPGVESGRGGGITIEDCSRVSRMLGDYLDGDSDVATQVASLGEYSLEVSSPGIDRPLKKPEHFARFRGQTASVSTYEKVLDRVTHVGVIVEVGAESIVLDQPELGRTEIRFSEIRKAHLKCDPWQLARESMARRAETSPESDSAAGGGHSLEGIEQSLAALEHALPRDGRSGQGGEATDELGAGAPERKPRSSDPGHSGSRRGHRGGTES